MTEITNNYRVHFSNGRTEEIRASYYEVGVAGNLSFFIVVGATNYRGNFAKDERVLDIAARQWERCERVGSELA